MKLKFRSVKFICKVKSNKNIIGNLYLYVFNLFELKLGSGV